MGVRRGDYTASRSNRRYAASAVELLRRDGALAEDKTLLWSEVLAGEPKRHNSQMDVVIALWDSKLINQHS
jgi:hypothetical protein